MRETPQTRALKNYRDRLNRSGMARFEVLGLDKDRDLIRSVARRPAENSLAAEKLRAAARGCVTAGADLDITRSATGS